MSWKNMATRMRLLAIGALVVFSLGAAGEICGGALDTTKWAFESSYKDNNVADIQKVLARIGEPATAPGKPHNSSGIPVAVLVTAESPRTIAAVDLRSGKKLWKIAHPIRSEITLGGDLVIFESGTDLVARHVADGHTLWQYPIKEGWEFLGAAVDGDSAVISLGIGGKEPGDYADGKVVALRASTGVQLWEQRSSGGLLGKPAVYKQTVFIPWDRQKIAVLDLADGKEICRVLASDYTINYVEAQPAGVYFGSLPNGNVGSTIFRFNEDVATGKREGSTVFVPNLKPIPGEPSFREDAFSRRELAGGASGKIRMHFQPVGSHVSSIAMMNGQFYLHYWHYLVAFDAATSQVRWTYNASKDIQTVEVTEGGVLGIDAAGRLFFVSSATGNETWSRDTDLQPLYAAFDADGFNPGGAAGDASPPQVALDKIAWDKDNRMLPIRAYAVALLSAIPVPEVTRDLLKLYGDPATPEPLRDQVVKAIEKRQVGAEYLVEALETHYDFLEQTTPPPMDVIAPALVNMKERSAIPGLLGQLTDHETPVAYLQPILSAIIELGDESVLDGLKKFLTLYHADSAFLEHEAVLARAGEGILKFGKPDASEQFIVQIRDNTQTLPELKYMLAKALQPIEAAREAEKAKAAAEAAGGQAQAAAKAEVEAPTPNTLSHYQISDTMQKYADNFRPCVSAALKERPNLRSIRLRFEITGENGTPSDLKIIPNNIGELEKCLSEGLSKVTFPVFRQNRQTASYEIKIQ